jgi:hypothetical protein
MSLDSMLGQIEKDGSVLLLNIEALDSSKPKSIVRVEKKEFYFEIEISNAGQQDSRTTKWLKNYFGGTELRIQPGDGHNILIQVSRVKKDLKPQMSDFFRLMEKNSDKGWFLGIGPFGPEFLDSKSVNHAFVGGASGFGKSTLFKSLIAQNAAFNDRAVNIILDPKGIDYSPFNNHPRVPIVATNAAEFVQVFQMLWIELAVRRHFFNSAFENVPSKLDEYTEFKNKYGRSDLPDFKHIFVWIDEFGTFIDMVKWSYQEHYSKLVTLARAFGIHFIGTAQRFVPDLVPSAFKAQCSHFFAMYIPNPGDVVGIGFQNAGYGEDVNVPIPGHLNVIDAAAGETRSVRVPMASYEEIIGLAFCTDPSPLENGGIYPLSFPDDALLQSGYVGSSVYKGGKLPTAQELIRYMASGRGPTPEHKYGKAEQMGTEAAFAFSKFYNIKKVG